MFNGVPDQFYQFISSRSALTLPLPPFPIHASPPTFPSLDASPSHQIFQSHLLHQLHQSSTLKDEEKEEDRVLGGCLAFEGVRSIPEQLDPWTNEEELALMRIRSSMDNGFSYFIWEHVSRKLEELGFKRSAEKCKEKFEEMSKYCNTTSYNKNYRFCNELEALYQGDNPRTDDKMAQISEGGGEKMGVNLEENSGNETLENPSVEREDIAKNSNRKKRKRYHQFELFKGFCEEIVNKILVQQEELHNKLLEDVRRRDEERVAREEAWKKQEIDRLNMEIETKAQEQAIASDREARIIELLKKFTSSSSQNQVQLVKNENLLQASKNPNPPSSPSMALVQIPNSASMAITQNNPVLPISSSETLAHQNPDSTTTQNHPKLSSSSSLARIPQNPNSTSSHREDHGKRWPREEVNSLIRLRCNLCNNIEDKEASKIPIWERISQKMLELGYKRSAKRCKEKWENINKYFRRTKDTNKKRTPDSKTCPYFHQLSHLYNQGTLTFPSEGQPENHLGSPENCLESQETPPESSQCGGGGTNEAIVVHVDEVDKKKKKNMVVQVPAIDFES